MEVILLQKVDNLGALGDKVTVKPGYARNCLIPQGKAKFATPANIAAFEARRAELEQQATQALAEAQQRAAAVAALGTVRINAKGGTEGKLFGSVGNREIVEALAALGVSIEKRELRLPDGPFRVAGEHSLGLHLHAEVNAQLNILVVAVE
jgi:large subunit ribosomal protein L9